MNEFIKLVIIALLCYLPVAVFRIGVWIGDIKARNDYILYREAVIKDLSLKIDGLISAVQDWNHPDTM